MDRLHKNVNNAHHTPGVLGWQQLQHACLHEMHTFYQRHIVRTKRDKTTSWKNYLLVSLVAQTPGVSRVVGQEGSSPELREFGDVICLSSCCPPEWYTMASAWLSVMVKRGLKLWTDSFGAVPDKLVIFFRRTLVFLDQQHNIMWQLRVENEHYIFFAIITPPLYHRDVADTHAIDNVPGISNAVHDLERLLRQRVVTMPIYFIWNWLWVEKEAEAERYSSYKHAKYGKSLNQLLKVGQWRVHGVQCYFNISVE